MDSDSDSSPMDSDSHLMDSDSGLMDSDSDSDSGLVDSDSLSDSRVRTHSNTARTPIYSDVGAVVLYRQVRVYNVQAVTMVTESGLFEDLL